MSVIGGKLKFKGNFQQKINDEERSLKRAILSQQEKPEKLIKVSELPKEKKIVEHPITAGTGRILTSSKAVHGKDTAFQRELALGDTIIILNPQSLVKEERKITAILSEKSASLNEPFENDLMSYTQFEYKKKTEEREADETLEEKYSNKISSLSKKIKKEKTTLEYREKKGMWGYKNIKEKLEGDKTREELLDMRSKKNRDKFCWF